VGPGWSRDGKGKETRVFYVYLLASKPHGTLYIGITSDLLKRVFEHKSKAVPGFTSRYEIDKLVWFEAHDSVESAIRREKQIKEWRRNWKISLIERENPNWIDLYPSLVP
jgi:putative endonuclease